MSCALDGPRTRVSWVGSICVPTFGGKGAFIGTARLEHAAQDPDPDPDPDSGSGCGSAQLKRGGEVFHLFLFPSHRECGHVDQRYSAGWLASFWGMLARPRS